ncbi:MAG: Phosphoenolpyruvate synthase [Syntrophorhabdus sp. PtaU1.Bin050]|nr:MAG: Phosphoenolpyruvate synthase [Syntrophorhabdus sp. PtaU1.Bin050]
MNSEKLQKLVFWVAEVDENDNDIVGKKCANLGRMARLGFQVPPSFMISIEACRKFMHETGARAEIDRYVRKTCDPKDWGIKELEERSRDIQDIIKSKAMPADLKQEIVSHCHTLLGETDVAVSVRSSGAESRPGMFATYLNVKGEADILRKTIDVWASAFETRAISYRISKGIPFDADNLGVAVVKMVNARAAGVSFSMHPVTRDATKIVIESIWGLGEGVVKGTESVDRFLLNKNTLEILEKQIGKKEKCVISTEGGIKWEDVPSDKQNIASLSNEEMKYVANLAKMLEEKLECPQDTEWAIEEGAPFPTNIYLLQTRPAKITVDTSSSILDRMVEDVLRVHSNIDVSKIKPPKDIKLH